MPCSALQIKAARLEGALLLFEEIGVVGSYYFCAVLGIGARDLLLGTIGGGRGRGGGGAVDVLSSFGGWHCWDSSAVVAPEVPDVANVVVGFFAYHIAMLDHGVAVEGFLAEVEDVVTHFVPSIGVAAVFLRQGYGILHVSWPSVVGSQDKLSAFVVVADVGEALHEFADVAGSGGHVLLRLEDAVLCQSHALGCGWHQLHQAAGSRPRLCRRVKARFLVTLCRDESPVPSRCLRGLLEVVIVGRDNALLARDKGRAHFSAHLSELALALLFGQADVLRAFSQEPTVEGFGQVLALRAHGPGLVQTVNAHACCGQPFGLNQRQGQGQGRHVCLAAMEEAKEFDGVARQFDAYAQSLVARKVGCKGILQAHGLFVVFVVRLGAGQGCDNQFAGGEDAVHVRSPRRAIAHLGKGSVVGLAFLLLAGPQKREKKQDEAEISQCVFVFLSWCKRADDRCARWIFRLQSYKINRI